jgi:hypothetical protein
MNIDIRIERWPMLRVELAILHEEDYNLNLLG